MEKLHEFLRITHPGKSAKGVGLKCPDAKFSIRPDKLSCLSVLGMLCFKKNNFETSNQELSLGSAKIKLYDISKSCCSFKMLLFSLVLPFGFLLQEEIFN